jgi:hypothetical protein
MATCFWSRGCVRQRGTDNHLADDLANLNITGKEAQDALERAGIVANRNKIPYDTRSAMIAGGLRVGTPAITTRGFSSEEVRSVALAVCDVLREPASDAVRQRVHSLVLQLCESHPYPGGVSDPQSCCVLWLSAPVRCIMASRPRVREVSVNVETRYSRASPSRARVASETILNAPRRSEVFEFSTRTRCPHPEEVRQRDVFVIQPIAARQTTAC